MATALVGALALTGCASEIKIPVTGEISGGTPMAGQAIARMSGDGEFWVQSPSGLRCSGNYDSKDMDPTIIVPVTCSDGGSGQLVVTRSLTGNGTAIAQLKDGRTGQFVFGNIRFEQAFGHGAAGVR